MSNLNKFNNEEDLKTINNVEDLKTINNVEDLTLFGKQNQLSNTFAVGPVALIN